MFDDLIVRFGYFAVALGTFLEGEVVLLAAGAIAHKGLLSFPLVLCSATLGSLAWAQLWFRVSRAFGRRVIEARPAWHARAGQVERFIRRYGIAFVLGYRFVSGMGTLAPALLGATGYRPRGFVLFDLIGAALWSVAFGGVGFGLDAGLRELLGRPIHWDELISAIVGLGLLLWLATRMVQHAATPRAARVSAADDTPTRQLRG